MTYVLAGMITLIAALSIALKWSLIKTSDLKKEIETKDKRIKKANQDNKELSKKLQELQKIEEERRKKNAEIDNTDDSDVDDLLNGQLSNDSRK